MTCQKSCLDPDECAAVGFFTGTEQPRRLQMRPVELCMTLGAVCSPPTGRQCRAALWSAVNGCVTSVDAYPPADMCMNVTPMPVHCVDNWRSAVGETLVTL